MTVRFHSTAEPFSDGEPLDVSYAFGPTSADAPARGDMITADGTDDDFPEGFYLVVGRSFKFGLRGGTEIICFVEKQDADR